MSFQDYEDKFEEYLHIYKTYISDRQESEILSIAIKGAFDIRKDRDFYKKEEEEGDLDEDNVEDILAGHAANLNQMKRKIRSTK